MVSQNGKFILNKIMVLDLNFFVAPWVEEDDIIDEGWESLEITEAGDVVTSGQSSYLSSLWTWATSNPS